MLKTTSKMWAVFVVTGALALVGLGCGGSSSSNNSGSTVTTLPALSPPTGTVLTPGTINVPYSTTNFAASNGTAPYTFNVSPSPPFPGMQITQTAGDTVTLSGTPTQASSTTPFSFQIQVVDAASRVYTGNYTVFINALTLTPTTLPTAIHSAQYSQALAPAGGTAPYSFSLTAGSLTPGLTLDTVAGIISGIPTSVGSTTFTIQVEDASQPVKVGQQPYTLTVQ